MSVDENISKLADKVLSVLIKNGYVPSSMAHKRLAHDISEQGKEILSLAKKMSPSQLGKMRFLGIRWLAICKRDHSQKFPALIKDLEGIL